MRADVHQALLLRTVDLDSGRTLAAGVQDLAYQIDELVNGRGAQARGVRASRPRRPAWEATPPLLLRPQVR